MYSGVYFPLKKNVCHFASLNDNTKVQHYKIPTKKGYPHFQR